MPRLPQQALRTYRALTDFLACPRDTPGWESELLRLLAVAFRADALALLHTDPDTFLALRA